MIRPLSLFVFSFFALRAWGAACCGGGFAAPALIAGDERAMLTGSYLYSQIKNDVYPDGLWSKRDFREDFETFRLEGARILGDRAQAGFSLPLIKRARQGETSAGTGDLAATLGYEILPDWDYNPYRPRGLAFLQITAPTGRSVYEANSPYQLDARGRGFWAAGLGTLLTKAWGSVDAFVSGDIHRSFAKENLRPGWGGNFGVGAGYNLDSFRFGTSVIWTYEDPVEVKNLSRGSVERYATAALSLSYLHSDAWAGTVTYSDQSLIGDPVNARLAQSFVLQIQRRWAR